MQEPISDYRVIGDLYSAALVSSDGSIDWLCLPDFDSPSVFAAILDDAVGGRFSVDDAGYDTNSAYVADTAIIETTFVGNEHSFLVRDFMFPQPVSNCTNHILERKIVGQDGSGTVTLICQPRPQYGKTAAGFSYHPDNKTLVCAVGEDTMALFLPADANVRQTHDDTWRLDIPIAANETKAITLEYMEAGADSCVEEHNFEQETRDFWARWIRRGNYFDFCQDLMKRSAITLKLLQYYPTGAIVAAPTMSLPEEIGGGRNWDYRYVWVRDATFILYSLAALGLKAEAGRFFAYLEDVLLTRTEGDDSGEKKIASLDHFYTIHGSEVDPESNLDHLEGYKQSQPVRVGNSASDQFQLDSYGVVIDAFYLLYRDGMELIDTHRTIITGLVDQIKNRWQEKDNSIWEVRSGRKHYTYSKVMCWVGVNRALRMKAALGYDADKVSELKALADEIENWIWTHCFREDEQIFTQHAETDAQDATTFLYPLVQFLDKDDAHTKEIVESARSALCHNGVFVYRYLAEDGLGGQEGAFNLCTFWMISALAKVGKTEQARNVFDEYETHIASSGLMSEEIDPQTGQYLGNFPQGFSHLGYIMAAYYLNKYHEGS